MLDFEVNTHAMHAPKDLARRSRAGCSIALAVEALFCRLAVEVLGVGLRVFAGMVDDAVPMIRGGIERIELQGHAVGIDDVVSRPRRDNDREARADRRPYAIEHRLSGPFFYAKELVERVDFRPDLFLGL